MYEDHYGTDWEDVEDREEAVRRAFALGVAARLGERHPGELDRVRRAVDTSYDRSFVELAYHEGRDKASELQPEAADDDEVWEELVEGEGSVEPRPRTQSGPSEVESELPDALQGTSVDTRPEDSREVLDRPKFLTREGAEEPDRSTRRAGGGNDGGGGDSTEVSDADAAEFEEILEPDDEDDDH